MSEKLIISLSSKLQIQDKKDLFKIIAIFLLNKNFCKYSKQDKTKIYDIYSFDINKKIIEENILFLDSTLSNENLSDDFLGSIYEKCLDKEFIKDYGLFYTRDNQITDNIIDNYINSITTESKVFEPSSGSGLFIVRFIERLKNSSFNKTKLVDFVCNNIYFNDLDKFACFLTEYNILNSIIEDIANKFIENNNLKLNKLNFYNEDFSTIDLRKLPKFDFIFGNPPYVTLYGKRSRNMNNEKRIYYNSRYKFVSDKKKDNKFNLIMFFLENSLDLLNKNGVCSFIIDFSFFETAYADIRKYILQKYDIVNIHSEIKAWDNVASGQIILTLRNSYSGKNMVEWNVGGKITNIEQSLWLNDYKIMLPKDNVVQKIIDKINQKTNTCLGDFLDEKKLRTCCALTGRTEDFLKTEEEYLMDKLNIFKYLEGSKSLSGKFGELKHTNYIAMDYSLQEKISNEFKVELEKQGVKNKKRVTLGNKVGYESPKIFIRQSANELISTYTEEVFAANNSIYIGTFFINSEEAKLKLKFINAYLNSELATFIALEKGIIRRGIGKTPQIKISDLKMLSIINDKKIIDKLSSISDNPSIENIQLLNNTIYDFFNITDEDKIIIKKILNKDK